MAATMTPEQEKAAAEARAKDEAKAKADAEAARQARQEREASAAAEKAARTREIAHAVYFRRDGRMHVRGEVLTDLTPSEIKAGDEAGVFVDEAADALAEVERLKGEQAMADEQARHAKAARLQAEAIAKQRG